MGFEQLAELKKQLAASAKPVVAKASQHKGAPKKARPPVDPVVQTIGRLQNTFPKVFPKNPAPKVPLKIGIFKDLESKIKEIGINEDDLKAAINIWCRSRRYWACIIEGAKRLDLEGNEAGIVGPKDAEQARFFERREHRAKNAKRAQEQIE